MPHYSWIQFMSTHTFLKIPALFLLSQHIPPPSSSNQSTILLCFQKITILIKLCKQSLLFIFTFWLPLNWEQWPWLLKVLFRCYSSHSFYWCYNAGLKQPSEKQLLLVANAHMHWDPEYSDVKLIQTMMFLSELKSIAERALGSINSGSPMSDTSSIPIVLCADLNSLPDSGEQCLELLIKEK